MHLGTEYRDGKHGPLLYFVWKSLLLTFNVLEEEKKVDTGSFDGVSPHISQHFFSQNFEVFICVLVWFWFVFEEQSCYMLSLYSPGWPGTHRNPRASSLPLKVGIAVYATMPVFCDTLKKYFSVY